ncbi:MAG: GumC family protein [Pirellulaceae bacterium]
MSQAKRLSLSPMDLARALIRHKGKAFLFFLLVMSGAVAAILLMQPRYMSEAKLFVRLGRESVTLDPTATTGQTVSISESREVEINSIIEILRSRAVAEKVVEKLTPERILGGKPSTAAVTTVSLPADAAPSVTSVSKAKLQEDAVTEVDDSLQVYAPKRTTVISLAYEADSPELAQLVTNTVIEVYLSEHARIHRTAGSHDFFVEQEKLLREKLDRANADLRDAKNETGLGSIEGRRETLQAMLGSIESQIATTEGEVAAARAKSTRLDETVTLLPQRMNVQEVTGIANAAADRMREILYQLELEERDLRSKYTDDHPQVVAKRQQLEEARRIHSDQAPERKENTNAVNPNRQQLEFQLLAEQAVSASLLAKLDELKTQRDLVLDELKSLNHAEIKIHDLERESQLLDANYRSYAEKLEQARIDDALEQVRISNVNVVQEASYMADPVKPQKALILALGLAVAMFGTLTIALSADYLDPSLRSSDEVEEQLELPVLVSVPRVSGRGALIS